MSNSTGAPTYSTSAAPRCATSWSPTRCTGCRSTTSTACGWTPSRRCSTWTTRGPAGGWTPNVYGGRENLEAVQFLQEMNATVHKIAPGIVTIAEESTSWPGVTRPTNLGGLGFSMKWNMGWMNDTLDVHQPRSDPPQLPPPRDDVLDALRVQRELRAADQPRRGGARQGHAVGPDARQRPRQGRRDCAACWPTSGRIPASSCCSWARSSASARSGPRNAGVDWYQLGREQLLHRHPADGARHQRHLPQPGGRCGHATPAPRATPGSTPTTRPTTC